MSDYRVYWGDLHTHHNRHEPNLPPLEQQVLEAEKLILAGKENIDFFAVLSYPFVWQIKNGLKTETMRNRPEFVERWERFKDLVCSCHDPGKLVLFAGYEWHGNRTRYGDHNVIYFDTDNPLLDSESLEDLYGAVRKRNAIVIPHHTAYYPGWRGKDWDFFDENLSPVMEVFSSHGSSEGTESLYALPDNQNMGPAVSGGSYQDALARGLRIGVIGSNDGMGLPGRWGQGRAAVLATELTREAIWEAFHARRTYAVTGDRIELDFKTNGAVMGSVIEAGSSVDVDVDVTASNAIDRIELVHNNIIADTYCHSGKWEARSQEQNRFKVLIRAGWGPAAKYGFGPDDFGWNLRFETLGGRITGIEKCFNVPGQSVTSTDETGCAWDFVTSTRPASTTTCMQGLILEIEGNPGTRIALDCSGVRIEKTIAELLSSSHLIPLLDESKARIKERFDVGEQDLENHDTFYQNSRKIKFHPAAPENAYRVNHRFKGIKLKPGQNRLYVRVSQLNGQMAWSSPIWANQS